MSDARAVEWIAVDNQTRQVPDLVAHDLRYAELKRVLQMAHDQAASGKGRERHDHDGRSSFEQQLICQVGRYTNSTVGCIQQAVKKSVESTRIRGKEAKIREILGAINYLAAAVLLVEEGVGE